MESGLPRLALVLLEILSGTCDAIAISSVSRPGDVRIRVLVLGCRCIARLILRVG
jgi:hypothetical protein